MASFLDDIIESLHEDDEGKEKDKTTTDEKEQKESKEIKRESLITYSDEFYKAFTK